MKSRRTRAAKLLNRIILFVLIGTILAMSLWQTPYVQKIAYPYPHRTVIENYASRYGVDPLLVVSVIREESKFLPKSESHKGAKGLMQLMPSTAKWIAESIGDKNYTENDLANPEKNIQYGTWYLSSLEKEFFSNLTLVLAAYNGGRGHVKEWIESNQINLENTRQQDIPFKETRDYVQRVLKTYKIYIKLYGK